MWSSLSERLNGLIEDDCLLIRLSWESLEFLRVPLAQVWLPLEGV